jgi:large subunit ribosomal protein L5
LNRFLQLQRAKTNKKVTMTQRLKNFYKNDIVPKLSKTFEYKNLHEVPKVVKVVINRGLGESAQNAKSLEASLNELSIIAGQRGLVTRSKKAIAGFKVREGMPIGMTVTLRGERMYAFLDRLINLALPRIRDFQGISPKSFDGHGNYSLGVEEQLMFPEINYDKIEQVQGMDISIVTSCQKDEEGKALLVSLGMPFKTK